VTRPGVALALAGLLAAGCAQIDQPPTTETNAEAADQVAYGVTHILTNDGLRRMLLEADSVYAFTGPQRHQLFGIHVTFYSPEGAVTSTLTAKAGTYEWRTGNMEARGDVVTVTPDGRRLETSVLQYDRALDRIVGPEAFHWTTATQDVVGDGFTSDPELKNVQTTRARGVLGPVQIEK